jgi:hypothetical protein
MWDAVFLATDVLCPPAVIYVKTAVYVSFNAAGELKI